MSHDEFQTQVLTVLTGLSTKMDILVGEDGNGGRLADHEKRIRKAEEHNWRSAGIVSAVTSGVISAVIGLWRSH